MTDRRKRSPEGTVQARVWRLLHANGPMTAKQTGEELGVPQECARRAAFYLIERGRCVKGGHPPCSVTYAAIGKYAPQDRRGKPPGCRNHEHRNMGKLYQKMMRKVHGEGWMPPAKTDAHPLARAWR